VRALALLVMLAGCDLVFKVEVPDLCRDAGPFIAPVPLDGLPSQRLFDPTLRADGLQLFFSQFDDLFVVTRDSTSEPFGMPQQTALSTPGRDFDPSLTLDGLRLFYLVDNVMFESVREKTIDAFGFGQARVDIEDFLHSFEVSHDGLTIYYNLQSGGFFMARRATLVSAFGARIPLGEGRLWPSISHDELELFYEDEPTEQVFRITRDSRDAPFEGMGVAILQGADPEISDSGEQLMFGPPSHEGFAVAERICN